MLSELSTLLTFFVVATLIVGILRLLNPKILCKDQNNIPSRWTIAKRFWLVIIGLSLGLSATSAMRPEDNKAEKLVSKTNVEQSSSPKEIVEQTPEKQTNSQAKSLQEVEEEKRIAIEDEKKALEILDEFLASDEEKKTLEEIAKDFLNSHTELGDFLDSEYVQNWAQGQRRRVFTTKAHYLFYYKNSEVITVYNMDMYRKEVWRKEG